MMRKLKSGCRALDRPGHRRERAFGAIQHARNRGLRIGAKIPGIECRNIRVGNHRIGGNHLAIGQNNTAHFASLRANFSNFAVIAECGTSGLGQCRQYPRQPVHPTLDRPHATLFSMRNQQQSRRRGERRSAAIRGVAAEELPQFRIGEIFA